MTRQIFIIGIAVVIMTAMAAADDHSIFVVSNQLRSFEGDLDGYPGRFWGKTVDKIYLSGGYEEAAWLRQHNFDYKAIEFDGDNSSLYLCYIRSGGQIPDNAEVLDSGDGYYLSNTAPAGNASYRRLSSRRLPISMGHGDFNILLTYSPVVDSLISEVNQDTLFDFLSRLTGASPIIIDDQLDTIHTRYSGTPDNELAARYLKEILEGYGYETEYHAFYGGRGRHMAAYDENVAWMVTEDSEALRTIDGGVNWTAMPVNVSSSLWGVANVGSDSVWIVGNRGAIRFSSDGGDNFTMQSSGSDRFLFGVNFIDPLEGWIAGDNGLILHTSNAGQNWESQATPTSSRLYDVCFVDSDNGWAVGRDGTIIHTADGGAVWSSQNSNTNQRLYGVDFVDPNEGWVVGWSGVVRHTTNGGADWQIVNLGSQVEKYHVDFADPMHGCIVGWDGEIFTTTDGGESWTEQSSGTSSDFYGVEFADILIGFAVGNGIIAKTTDGGVTWINQTSGVEGAWRNVIATRTGTIAPDQQVVICGHMDDRSEQSETYAPGADDNGSGTTAVIEAARIFAGRDFEKTIKFCLWTGEEQGLLGSAAYAQEAYARGDDIVGVYNFDMIAWDGNGDGSTEFHCGTMNPSIELGYLLNEVVDDYGIALDPDIITYGSTGASDHASFWDYDYPAMLGIEDYSNDFNPYYHTTGDNIEHIMLDFFTEFTKAAVGATATLAVPDTTATFVHEEDNLPAGFALHENYPNPFNAATTISFTIPSDTEINLSLYDILGREVALLYTGMIGAGTHRITWNAGERPSGVYFYRLSTADGVTAAGRMTLLK